MRQQVRRIGSQFLSSVEIGAQDVYLVLQMQLRKNTRDVVYVDINRAENRTSQQAIFRIERATGGLKTFRNG